LKSPPIVRSSELFSGDLDSALREWGGFLLETTEGELPWRGALAAARDLFGRPHAAKADLTIERSLHFRGWSEMHTERDWREQLHLGRQLPVAGQLPAFLRLEGPNLSPPDLEWRRAIYGYMDAAAALGERVLVRLAEAIDLAEGPFAGIGRDGYLVMKLIGYHPQPSSVARRSGVAPHVDFSWLTLTLQESPGLEVLTSSGCWSQIEPHHATLWVHAGELLQFATGGRYQAVAHRVVNHSLDRMRISIPLFVNPPLESYVPIFPQGLSSAAVGQASQSEHIHRVLPPDGPAVSFHFGEAEWQRKGLGHWCAACKTGHDTNLLELG
jgi:isopenicillin N synthase-like dioxygenase